MDLTRRAFLGRAMAAAGGAAVVVSAACGSEPEAPPPVDGPPPNCLANGTSFVIPSNHGHSLMVPIADIEAGTIKTYDITGGADHPHEVTINASQFAMLAANQNISLTSTFGGGHAHMVSVRCR